MKKTLKLKPSVIKTIKIVGILIAAVIAIFVFYHQEKTALKQLGYTDAAISNIFKKWKVGEVKEIKENKTVNAAFESASYKDENLSVYQKVKYQNQKHLIQNINTLTSKKYKPSEISMILEHGNDLDVTNFAKRKKVKYLEQFFSVSYAKLKNYDRYVDYYDKEREDAETTVLRVNMDFDKEDYTDYLEISDFNENVLVNKHRQLTSEYVPKNLKNVPADLVKTKGDKIQVVSKVLTAFKLMKEAAEKEDRHLLINSGYRSYQDQEEITATYLDIYGQKYVDNYVAKAGFSEHQTGMSIDIASADTDVFLESDEYDWLMENAYLYGFILRYPKSKEEITGYKCEAWHYRYVGKKIAKYIHDNNITYDEYYIEFLDTE